MNANDLGGVIHVYQKYDPVNVPGPASPPPDLVTPAFEHLLMYGNTRRLTPEELARAVKLDLNQIKSLGPSLEALMEILRERKRKILAQFETNTVQHEARNVFQKRSGEMRPPGKLAKRFHEAVRGEQLHDLEQLWYQAGDERGAFAKELLRLAETLGDKYQVDELAAKYQFTGQQGLTIPKALQVKAELENIDKLLKQLEEAMKTAQLGVIDMDELAEYVQPGDLQQLHDLQKQIEEYMKTLAAEQGLEQGRRGFDLTPKAYRIFQSRLLSKIFEALQASRSGRHAGPVVGEGATEMQQTKPYEFGDSVANMDIPASMVNAMLRSGCQLPVRLRAEDIEIHKTRNNPKCATALLLDMSGSMRYDGQYVNVKRMGLALEGLIRKDYPGDFLQFIEVYSFAKPRSLSEIPGLMPKPVTIHESVVRLKADMSDPEMSEVLVPPHFTNIQHGLQLARKFLSVQDTPNRQVILITDGLPTAHFEGSDLYLLYPPHRRTEEATLREAQLCAKAGITINIFLLSSWSQTEEDVHFAYNIAESTRGRVFFAAGKELDRYVVWDYVSRRRQIIG